ncbi:MAG: transcriptional regulator [Actinomycetia bacterium]|nr:transcriptional regulator [Actinomycetes bacterium]
MDLRQLNAFLAVVEHGTMTAAAPATFVSQPALSQTLRSLEAELGTALFHRIGRGLVLTAAGEALVGPAQQVLRSVDQARRAVTDVAGVEGGTLDLVLLPTLAVDPAAPLLGRFRREHPGVSLRLTEPDGTADALARVVDGRAELALTDAESGAGLVFHSLGAQEHRAVFPAGTAPGRKVIKRSALVGLPFVTTPPGTSSRRLLEQAHEDAGAVPVIAVEAGPREAILPLVVAGAGVALLPVALADEAAALGADVRRIDPPVTREVTLAHRDAALSPAAAALVILATSG